MISKKIWVSTIRRNHDYQWFDYYLSIEKNNPRAIIQYKATNNKEEEARLKSKYDKELSNYIDLLVKKNRSQEKLALEDHPNRVYKMPEEKWECNKSIFMLGGGFIFVNETTVQILKQHNLGDSQLIKVEPYDAETDEPVKNACSLYLLHIAEAHECCDVEQSKNIYQTKFPGGKRGYADSTDYLEDGYVVNASVLDLKLDIWMDPRLNQTIFVSNHLKVALEKAGLAEDWFFFSGSAI